MKHLHYFITLLLFFVLIACSGPHDKTAASNITPSDEYLTKNASSEIAREGGWVIYSKIENGDHVYWFLAPEVNKVSPALFKKIIYNNVDGELKTKTVSQCDAPKQTCEELIKKYEILSEKYK